MSLTARVPALAPFQIRSFRYQWPADLLASWAFEMEGVILGWFVLVSTGSVLALAVFGSLQFLGTLISPLFGMAGDRIGNRTLLCLMRATYLAVAAALALVPVSRTAWKVPLQPPLHSPRRLSTLSCPPASPHSPPARGPRRSL